MEKKKVEMWLELEVLGETTSLSKQEEITFTVNFKGLTSADDSKDKRYGWTH